MAECEDQLRTGNRVDSDAPYLNVFLSGLLGSVGRFDEAGELTRLAYTHDPYDEFKIRDMLRMFEFEGEKDEARELYQKGVRWFPGYKPMFFRNRLYGLIERADFPAMQRLEQEIGVKDLIPGYTSSSVLVAAVKAKSIAAARRACPDTEAFLLTLRCMLVLSSLGDQDGAYAIADKLYLRRVGRTPAETERIWLDDPERSGGTEFITSPAAAPMRRDPRYLQLAERTGLLAYWRTGRAPDFCRKKPEPICRTLLKRG